MSQMSPLNPMNQVAIPKFEKSEDTYQGPAWDNLSEYFSFVAKEFVRDLFSLDQLIGRLENSSQTLQPLIEHADRAFNTLESSEQDSLIAALQTQSAIEDQATTLLLNLWTFTRCERDIDGTNTDAQQMNARLEQTRARLATATTRARLFLVRAPESLVQRYLMHEHTAAEGFALKQARALNDRMLSETDQTFLEQLRTDGFDAWSGLYQQLASTLRCRVELEDKQTQTMGLAQASGLTRHPSEGIRRHAWQAIQESWRQHEVSGAAILNGLAGWRLSTYRRRSTVRHVDFLDLPLHSSHIKPETLEAMMTAVTEARPMAQKSLLAIAQGLGKSQLDPWDLLAPAPTHSRRTFAEGLALIRDAFAAVDPAFADFVDTMEKNRWIEGRVLPNKQQGAYCTRFAKSHTPRVFQTYLGSISDIRTLAHELGHAYHAWVMRDLPSVLHRYPTTLAETASIFAETVFAEHLSRTGSPAVRFEIAWQNAESAASFLLNIPARFDFEKKFYERRQSGAFVNAEELGDLTEQAWQHWYGDTLSKPDRQYWLTKLHFSMSRQSFYNYPYTFGYLFSLSVFALKDQHRRSFLPVYNQILRDTGRMTAEDLARIYLYEDITKPEFWRESLRLVEEQVTTFQKLLAAQTSLFHSSPRATSAEPTP